MASGPLSEPFIQELVLSNGTGRTIIFEFLKVEYLIGKPPKLYGSSFANYSSNNMTAAAITVVHSPSLWASAD